MTPEPDDFFTNAQIARSTELMDRWRQVRDSGSPFPAEERAELDALIAAELSGATARAAARLTAPNR